MSSIGSFVRLVDLVPPPDFPTRSNGDWKRFASVNGFPPPEDYRMLIREYGAGTFVGWIHLIEPFNHSWSFIEKAQAECEVILRNRQRSPQAYPDWSIWPDPGGMLPWAVTASGDHIGWRTVGRPDDWTTLFWSAGGRSSAHDFGMIEFILAVVENTLAEAVPADRGRTGLAGSGREGFIPAEL